MENKTSKYEKLNVYFAALSIVISVMVAVIYVAVSIAKMETKIDLIQRISTLENEIKHLQRK